MSAAEPSTETGTEYVVLQRRAPQAGEDGGVHWHWIGEITAKSAEAAIRAEVAKLAEAKRSGTFVAVPMRNWNPVTVREEIKRELVIGA